MRKLELYYSPGSASLVVHWLLIELNLPHTLHALDLSKAEHKTADYLKLNPAGVVPTLMIDAKPITEAAAICLHLADSFKVPKVLSSSNTLPVVLAPFAKFVATAWDKSCSAFVGE